MSFADQITNIKSALLKKLKCCAPTYIDKEMVNVQLEAIVKKIDELENTLKQKKKVKGNKDA